jgi:ABC-type transporter Mla maintaining outer membrane lipid asymmetry permease subunit MlaE
VTGLRNYLALNAQILYWIFLAPLQGKPRFKFSQVFQQMVRIGVQALPMTSLTAFSIGLTLAMQGAYQLAKFGATSFHSRCCGNWVPCWSAWWSLVGAVRQLLPNLER